MRQRGLSGSRGSPEDQRARSRWPYGVGPGRKLTKWRALAEEVLLSHNVVKGARPHPDGQGAPLRRAAACRRAVGRRRFVTAVVVIAGHLSEEIIHIDTLLIVHHYDFAPLKGPP
jgi:hypothetical protein